MKRHRQKNNCKFWDKINYQIWLTISWKGKGVRRIIFFYI